MMRMKGRQKVFNNSMCLMPAPQRAFSREDIVTVCLSEKDLEEFSEIKNRKFLSYSIVPEWEGNQKIRDFGLYGGAYG